jgi:CheY-like chemotaxis protein/anti-sigma regulatory factor (Ser/Thr protein kinase)
VRPSAEAKRIDLRRVIGDRGGIILGDASRLQQAIWNVLSNAVKFTGEGGRIEARLARSGGQIEISISDTGIGIESHFLPYVFERFRQADSSSTRRYGGLGLGLAIVRHIVEMHGGSITATSPGKGQGSTFTFMFPAAEKYFLPKTAIGRQEPGAAPASEPTGPATRCRLDGLRVLVVEDDQDTLDMLRMVLDHCGASVATAASAREGLNILEQWKPDALISDVAMPDEDGFALIGQVRSLGADRGGNIPAVALTAFTRDEDRAHALSAGFQRYVMKPVAPDELVAVVASLTGRVNS